MRIPLHASIIWSLKNHLGIITCFCLMLASYAGFVWLAAHPFSESASRTRMYVYARLAEESGKKVGEIGASYTSSI